MKKMKIAEKTEIDSVSENKIMNEALTTELHFELLKQYAWLASAVIGIMIVIVKLNTIDIGQDLYIALGLVGASVIFPMFGQDIIVDSLMKGKTIYKRSIILQVLRFSSMGCLAFGVSHFLSLL